MTNGSRSRDGQRWGKRLGHDRSRAGNDPFGVSAVVDLPALIAGLPLARRERAERLYEVSIGIGHTDPPAEMADWLIGQFGSVEAIRDQVVTRVQNRWSLEETLFSALRARRPIQGPRTDVEALIASTVGDPFCDPLRETPADTWGRIQGRHVVTGANAAKYDAHHAVLIFDRHDPLAFDVALVRDLLEVGRAWAERTRQADAEATAYLLTWNCGWRAGASIVHGHAQALLGRGIYGAVARLRREAAAYRQATAGRYLLDLAAVHADLGLAAWRSADERVTVLASLTPRKEREVLVVGVAGMDELDDTFAGAVARTVVAYRDALGVRSFNLALHRAELGGAADEGDELGPVVHLVDRGDPSSPTSDIGAMELYAASVVSSDPFEVASILRVALAET